MTARAHDRRGSASLQGMGASAASKLRRDADATAPLRTLLSQWLQAQWAFIKDLPNTKYLTTLPLPRTVALSLCPPADSDLERCAYLLTWQASNASLGLFSVDSKELAVPAKVTIASAAPVQFPVSNPLAATARGSQVFWRAPHYVRAHKAQAASDPLPQGNDWLDHELRQALMIAVPYLSVHCQRFWKDATVPPPGGILVQGGRGAGKTALLDRCAATLAEHPMCLCHVSRVSGRELAGEKTKRVCVLHSVLVCCLFVGVRACRLDDELS